MILPNLKSKSLKEAKKFCKENGYIELYSFENTLYFLDRNMDRGEIKIEQNKK